MSLLQGQILIFACDRRTVFSTEEQLIQLAAGLLGNSSDNNFEIGYGRNKKPYFLRHPELCFSVTHSGDYWMCAFSGSPAVAKITFLSASNTTFKIKASLHRFAA